MAKIPNEINPNKQQASAIKHPPGPLMILAGAGTGKTFTLENRIIYLINHFKVDPKHILAITYTEKAATELKERIVKKVGPIAQVMTVNTFHSFCLKLLKEYTDNKLPNLFDESEAIHLLLERFDEFDFESDEFPLNPKSAVTESFIPFFNRIRDELIQPEMMNLTDFEDEFLTPELINQLRDLSKIYPLFQSWKQELNVFDYGDMILQAYELLMNNPNILSKVRDQYRHIIVDEFQDNNFALNEIIGLIAGQRQFVTVVGDDDQVIYSFRGANSNNINNFEKKYQRHDFYKSVALETNFRSTQPILNVANAVIEKNVDRMEKTLISSKGQNGDSPIQFTGSNPEQLQFIIEQIHQRISEGYSYKDIAILCRTHSKIKEIIPSLQQARIPHQIKWPSYFNIPEIRTIISWCQVVGDGQQKEIGLYRLIDKECGYEIAHNIYTSIKSKKRKSTFDILYNNKSLLKENKSLEDLINSIHRFKLDINKKSAGEMIWDIVTHLKILKQFAKSYSMDDHFLLLNIGDFLKRSQEFTKRNRSNNSLNAFNIYMDAIMSTKGLPSIQPPVYSQNDAIILNTIHGVKGGEFPIVFLPFLQSNGFPLNPKSVKLMSFPPSNWLRYKLESDLTLKELHYQEERRLFYVGITRAKEILYLLKPPKRESKFIKNIPSNLLEEHTMTTTEPDKIVHSQLKLKYEQKLQKALAREQFEKIKQFSDALAIIKKHELNEPFSLGKTEWEIELSKELNSVIHQPPNQDRIHLSASAIDTYKQCPLKFRFARIDGIPQTASKPELTFGTIIHSVLQRFHEPEKDLTTDRILRLFEEEWQPGEFDYSVREEKFKEQGAEMLIRYCKTIQNQPQSEVIAREEKFTFDLGHITIQGAIDRIDKSENGIEILDYKTSKSNTPAKSNLQLAIYSMYLEQLDDQIIGGLPAMASLYFLRDEEKPIRSHSFSSDELAEKKEEILDVAAGIRNRQFEAKTGFLCNYCDYKNLVCPAFEEE